RWCVSCVVERVRWCVYAQRMNCFIDGEDIRLPSSSINRGLLLLLCRRCCSRRAGPLPQRSLVFVGRRLLLPLLPSLLVVALLPLLLAFLLLLLLLLLAVLPFLLQLVLLNF